MYNEALRLEVNFEFLFGEIRINSCRVYLRYLKDNNEEFDPGSG